MARADTTQTLYFSGLGLGRGDRIKWVRSTAKDCHSREDMTRWVSAAQGIPTSPNPVWARFHFPPITGPLILCYRFMYDGKPWMTKGAYIMYPNIRANVVSFDKLTPNGTAVGCSSQLNITGKSFMGLGAQTPSVTCGFGEDGARIPATVVNDTFITCQSPAPTSSGVLPMRIDFGEMVFNDPWAFPHFMSFDHSWYSISSVTPGAGAYQFTTWTTVTGVFEDFGQPRCRFGSWMGTGATVVNSTYVICDKPPFANSERFVFDAYPVAFTPNVQCPPPGSMLPSPALVSQGNSFRTYNSQVNELLIKMSPSTSSAPLQISGEGFVFPGDPSGICRFRLDNGTAYGRPAFTNGGLPPVIVNKPLTALSTTLVQCPPPFELGIGFYEIDVLQNGGAIDPTASGTPLQFEMYDLAGVAPISIEPRGGGLGEPATVTITGTGFRDMGAGELGIVCVISTNITHFIEGAHLALARMLSPDTLICDIPASVTANPSYGVDGEQSLLSLPFPEWIRWPACPLYLAIRHFHIPSCP